MTGRAGGPGPRRPTGRAAGAVTVTVTSVPGHRVTALAPGNPIISESAGACRTDRAAGRHGPEGFTLRHAGTSVLIQDATVTSAGY